MKRSNPLTLTAGLLLAFAALSCDHPTEPTKDIVSPAFTTIGTGVTSEMTVIGTLGGKQATATDINGQGQVVGRTTTAAQPNGPWQAFVWEEGVWTNLLPGWDSQARGVNEQGQVVGIWRPVPGYNAAFWEETVPGEGWNFNDLGSFESHYLTEAWDINDVGQVVGHGLREHGDAYTASPFFWADGAFTRLEMPGEWAYAKAINNQGQIVGHGVTAEGPQSAFLWEDPWSAPIPLTGLAQAWDINDLGQVAGLAGSQAAIWEDGTLTLLGWLSPGEPSGARGINNLGEVVGYSNVSGVHHAFHWKDGVMTDLHEPPGEWSFPYAINDHGQTVGYGPGFTHSGFDALLWSVAETDVAPVVHSISLPVDPVPVGTTVPATATFTDPNPTDFHTAVLDWGEGELPGTVSESGGSGTVSGSFSYTLPGVYTVQVTVSDGDLSGSRSSALDEPAFVVVYDPDGGFVTGGGWIMSPEGAYAPDPSLTGKASFGFVSKYKKGASVPTGNTEFKFQAGDLNFHSSQYQWLVVNQGGANAQFKGSGTINGAGIYKFMLWAGDGDPDTFRIKIWEEDELGGETDVYDNGFGQEIGGGSIVIHTK